MPKEDLAKRVEDRAASEAKKDSIEDDEAVQLVFAVAAGTKLALHIHETAELVCTRELDFTQLPRLAPPFAGIVRRRGRLIPVVDAGLLISNSPSDKGMQSRLIICRCCKGEAALIVDEVSNVTKVGWNSFREVAAQGEKRRDDFIAYIVELQGAERQEKESEYLLIDFQRLWEHLRSLVPAREAQKWQTNR